MTDKELEEKAEKTVKRYVCGDCNKCQSHGYIGCDVYKYSKDSFIAGAKAMHKENEQQEMMIICNEKIDDLRRVNKKLKTKLENTERKIREISQKCYEVEDIESIISDLNNLSMELEE